MIKGLIWVMHQNRQNMQIKYYTCTTEIKNLAQSEEHVKCMLYVSFFGSLVARKNHQSKVQKFRL